MKKSVFEKPGFTLFALFFASVLAFLDRQLLNILVGPIRSEIGISDLQFSVLQGAAFSLVYCVAAFPIAFFSDRYSRKVVIIVCIAIWSLMTLVFGVGTSFFVLILVRMGVAVGEAGLTPASMSIVRQIYPTEKQSMAVALLTLSVYLGGGVSMIVGGPALAAIEASGFAPFGLSPWRVLFAACGALGLVGVIILLMVPEPHREPSTAIQASMREFLRLVSRQRLRVGAYLAAFIGLNALVYAVMSWTPEIFIRQLGWTTQKTGLVYGSVYIVGGICGALLAGRMVGRLVKSGCKNAVVIVIRRGTVLLGFGATLFALSPSNEIALFLSAVSLFGIGALFALATYGFQALFPSVFSARAVAIYFLVPGTIGASMGPSAVPLIGGALADEGNIGIGLSVFAAAMALWAFVWLSLFLRAPVMDECA